jgi:[ribosomal protein S18]-alanine N-acetyltransferase
MIYRVRRMAAADVDAVVKLASDLPTAPHWPREAYITALDPQREPVRIAEVAVTAEVELLGFAVCSVVPPQAELESIVVAPQFQRMGVARRLFEVLTGDLAGAGVTEVLLEVRASNDAALGLYTALGFEETGRRRGYYGTPVEDAVLLRRPVEQAFG